MTLQLRVVAVSASLAQSGESRAAFRQAAEHHVVNYPIIERVHYREPRESTVWFQFAL